MIFVVAYADLAESVLRILTPRAITLFTLKITVLHFHAAMVLTRLFCVNAGASFTESFAAGISAISMFF